MKIKKHKFRNIGPYGNKWQDIKFEEDGSLNLILGKNGRGKCVHSSTTINIEFGNAELEDEFIEYLKNKDN